MEKIILVCREPGNHGDTVALLGEIFPECTVEIVTESQNKVGALDGPSENMGSSFQVLPFLGSLELEV